MNGCNTVVCIYRRLDMDCETMKGKLTDFGQYLYGTNAYILSQ
jgi:hypothetical protein